MRTWVIPDVHGCLRTLRALVDDQIEPALGDTFIFLGDLIDRGPDSKGVMDYVMNLHSAKLDVRVLRGNHEDFMASVYSDASDKPGLGAMLGLKPRTMREWHFHGGKETMQSFGTKKILDVPKKYIEWIETMEYMIEWNDFLIVHAGFNFANDDIFADRRAMLWTRDYQIDPEKLGNRKIIHGHVPVSLEFIFQTLNSGAYRFIDLDNGVYMHDKPGFGNLLALELNTMQLLIQHNLDF